jgi:hypothetical protein
MLDMHVYVALIEEIESQKETPPKKTKNQKCGSAEW